MKITSKIYVLLILISSLFIFSPKLVLASVKDDVCGGAGLSSGSKEEGAGCDTKIAGTPSINDIIVTGLNIFTAIVGIIAVVMVIVGGVKYMTSQGDSGKTAEAKNTVMYAAIGLVIVALAQVIVRFVLTKFTKV